MIKVVIFDFGGVLGSDSDTWETNFKGIIKATGLTSLKLQEVFDKHWPVIKIDKKRVSSFWNDVYKSAKNKILKGKLEKIYASGISLDQTILGIAKEIKKKGFKIVMLTNESRAWMKIKIKKFRLDKIFDKIYCSAFIRIAKPAPEAFTHVLNDLGVKTSEVLFIDNQENNIEVAKNLGIKTILFENQGQLKEELRNLLGNHRQPGAGAKFS